VVPAPDAANLEKLAQVLKRLEAEVEGAQEFESDLALRDYAARLGSTDVGRQRKLRNLRQ
jgi:hypothetical protein